MGIDLCLCQFVGQEGRANRCMLPRRAHDGENLRCCCTVQKDWRIGFHTIIPAVRFLPSRKATLGECHGLGPKN